MDIIKNWVDIKKHFAKSFKTNFHVAIASIDNENNPTVTPIGTLFLNDNQTGFYFEKFPTKLPTNAKTNKQICILAVKSNTWFWLKSLFNGYFKNNPAIKLYGNLGEKREASKNEIARLNRRMKTTRILKGNKYLWNDMKFVRDITFTKAEKTNLGKMA